VYVSEVMRVRCTDIDNVDILPDPNRGFRVFVHQLVRNRRGATDLIVIQLVVAAVSLGILCIVLAKVVGDKLVRFLLRTRSDRYDAMFNVVDSTGFRIDQEVVRELLSYPACRENSPFAD